MLQTLKRLIPDQILTCARAWPLGVIGAVLALTVALFDIARLDNLLYGITKVSLLGYAGYWIDRWLFPYARPHEHWFGTCAPDADEAEPDIEPLTSEEIEGVSCYITPVPQIRRAVIVAACILTATLIP